MNPKPRRLLGVWWNEPPNDWLRDFLESRDVLVWFQRGIASCGAALSVFSGLAAWSQTNAHQTTARLATAVLVTLILMWSLRWVVRPWPTRQESGWLLGAADAAIAAGCWLEGNRLAGLDSTVTFLLTGIYLIFFHGPRAQTAHVVVTLATTAALAVRLGLSENDAAGWALAGAHALLCLTVSVGVLPVLQVGFWTIRRNDADALIDPLTGLANRRGLDQLLNRRPRRTQCGMMCVFAIDLDNFKSINDRYGHLVGDDVLVRTAARIQSAVGPGGVVARIGGEEFVAVDLLQPSSVQPLAERIRSAIADTTEPQVTASIGVAITAAQTLPDSRGIAMALKCADNVMYAAKRRGGNAVNLHPCTAYSQLVGPA
ncbi:GGDEF domain-containing protein [Mycobacterium sp. M1]|uniref:GGDEF domain-containing protein n=1 Tax=Mycolicibacter acidiphilus TaxID=2835306 RepID=A0ABS5RFM3_9MYCO|nr:GGDEF domain-containing protein [Mycolicibacter acidiphilus]MBS9533081.1 GGDEF domain-containing protein [Mycolicibacter acidiphilus]